MKSLSKRKVVYSAFLLLIFSVFLLSGCTFLPKEEEVLAPPLVEPAELDYNTAEVKRGKIVSSVNGVGSLVPKNNIDLHYTKDGGRLKEIYVNKGDFVKKGDILAELDTGNLAFDIQQTELELEKAYLRHHQLLENEDLDNYTRRISELDAAGVRNRLNHLKKELEDAQIISPIDGVVTYVEDLRQGQFVPAYESIFQVAETTELQLEYSALNAEDLIEVSLGMEANLEIDGEEFKGEVVQVPNSVPSDVKRDNPEHYNRTIVIDIQDPPEDISLGDMVNLEIITAQKEDTLIIPRNALRSIIGRNFVQLIEDDTKREIDIQIGITSATEVEVLDGLEEGDLVIIR